MNIYQFLLLWSSALLFLPNSYAQYQTIQNGVWSDPASWLNGQVPPGYGNPTVDIYHTIRLNQDYSASSWQLHVYPTGSIVATACQRLGAYGTASQITNEGHIAVGILDYAGEVHNHGQLDVSYISLYGSAQPLFYNAGTTNFYSANFSGRSVLHNYGHLISDPSLSCSAQVYGLNFNGDSILNHALIDINTAQISGTFFQNDSGASFLTSGLLDFNNTPAIQFGSIIAQGDLQVNGGRLSNYGHLESASRIAVNSSGSLLENFGCDCHPSYQGEIYSPLLHISSALDNSGRIFIQNDVQAYGHLYSSSCGYLQAANLYSYDRLDGQMVICASLACYSCSSDGAPVFSCPADHSCNAILLAQDWLTNFELHGKQLSWNFWPDSSCQSLILQSSPNGMSNWVDLATFPMKEETQQYEDHRQLLANRYYRLLLEKQDGQKYYSTLLQRSLQLDLKPQLYPQPAQKEAFLLCPKISKPLRLFNLIGQIGRAHV